MDGTPQMHRIQSPGDVDWVQFSADTRHSYTIRTLELASGVDTVIELYTADGAPIAFNDDDPDNAPASRIDFTPTADGTYYVRVLDFDRRFGGCDATYQLSVQAADH